MYDILSQCHVIYRSPCMNRKNFTICIYTKKKKKKVFVNEFAKQVFEGHSSFPIGKKCLSGAAKMRFCKPERKNLLDSMRHMNSYWTTDLS